MRRAPEPIGEILAELMARRGFAGLRSAAACESAWREVVGDLASYTRVGSIRRGRLEVTVANSTVVQELSFRKLALLEALSRRLPDQKITDLRFRIGPIS
jgi:predicted nucleic acid-binding Zn ribbon protein